MAGRARYDRAEVLGKARDLFWRKGYHATSLKDLEAALDLRPGSIYAGFGSKEELFAEALALYAEGSRAGVEAIVSGAPSPLAGLAAHVRALGAACDPSTPSRACMLVKTVLETPDDDPILRKAAEDLMRRAEEGYIAVFEDAKAAGEIDKDADTERLARRFQAEIIGLRAYAQRTNVAEGVAELAEDIARDVEALRVSPVQDDDVPH